MIFRNIYCSQADFEFGYTAGDSTLNCNGSKCGLEVKSFVRNRTVFQTCSLYEMCSLFIVRCSVFRKSERTLFEVIWSKVDLVSFLSLQVKEIQKSFHQIHHLQLFGSQLDMFCLNVSNISIISGITRPSRCVKDDRRAWTTSFESTFGSILADLISLRFICIGGVVSRLITMTV